ncbi:MAG: dihydroorotase [Bacteroidetes bacterium]|nr:dihydroorotase [Bacteroidota bacterium]
MKILIKQAKIIFPESSLHQKIMDILIDSGKINEIKKSIIANDAKIIEANDLHVSLGWVDMQAVSGYPGYEYKEDIESLIKCAAFGGFTGIGLHTKNTPQFDHRSQIESIVSASKNKAVSIYPFGAVSQSAKGVELSEMYDMKLAGAFAFSDYKNTLNNSGTLLRALQYTKNINSLLINFCVDKSLIDGGQMNEGETSTTLGLKGMPALAEEIAVQQAISVLNYVDYKMHIPLISCKGSIEAIKKAKQNNLNVTCGVSSIHLLLDDAELSNFDTNLKLNPPLRNKKDKIALKNALESGIIDVVVSDHCPQDIESKELEFDYAKFGAINLQTCFASAYTALGNDLLDVLINSLTIKPRKILGLNSEGLAIGEPACLTLFSTSEITELTDKNNFSKSKNSPFFNKKLSGKVLGVINNNKLILNEN